MEVQLDKDAFLKLLCNYQDATLSRIFDILEDVGIILIWKDEYERIIERIMKKLEDIKKAWLEIYSETDAAIVLIEIGQALTQTNEYDTFELKRILEEG